MTNGELNKLVGEFTNKLSDSLEAFTGKQYYFDPLSTRDKIVVRLRLSDDGKPGAVLLHSQGKRILGLQLEYWCRWDSTNSYLAVEKSSFSVFPYGKVEGTPLFRVDYDRRNTKQPSSHIHIHGHRDEFTHLLGFTTKVSPDNSSKVKKYFDTIPLISNFHFPTGGHRFRPCLEDVLETLRIEFNLDVDNNRWSTQLKKARLRWREIQTAAVVRDCPQAAFQVLTEELGMPVPEGWECPQNNQDKILRN
ncbi:hypothetical protein [Corynebacterium phocae]|uniref:hypothetical protein n=1 Tax=Corynebacterium phocae TaxID=161895 RepID=UPI000952EF2A|nr:hypothetical protein [Corynebacterium phocae]KAA8728634.1 hypothetical protein F4V58_00075 [Corynebacterium phocae]